MQFESALVSNKATVSKTYSLFITILISVYHFLKSILSFVFKKVSLKFGWVTNWTICLQFSCGSISFFYTRILWVIIIYF
jgi:hypothetical protein